MLTVLCLSLLLALSPLAGQRAGLSAKVAVTRGRPTLFIDGAACYPMLYALTDVPGGRWTWEELPAHNIANFARLGVRLFQVDLHLEHLWRKDAALDITPARRQIRGILERCPDAAVIFRLNLSAPRWWTLAHPEEWVGYADTDYMQESLDGFPRIIEQDNFPVRRVSLASAVWKDRATGLLQDLLRGLAATEEGNALAGVQVAGGIYGEWHNWGFFRNEPDTGPAMTRHFRSWLKDRYTNDHGLEAAWSRPGARIAEAEVPGLERRATSGLIRDPSLERDVIDYYRCAHELVADGILGYARTVKETWPRPIVTGTFYGYFFSTFGRQAAGGHLELQRLLCSPWIDYLSGPQAYEPAALKNGEAYRSRCLIASIRLHGKLWLDEMDVDANVPIPAYGNHDLLARNSVANVRRNLLFSFTKGMGLWFYDFGVGGVDLDGIRPLHRGSRGTWDHSLVLSDIGALKKLMQAKAEEPYRSAADVLFVYDTQSLYYTASLRGADPVTPALIDFNTLSAFSSGVVFDPLHINDLALVDLTPYRVIVFGNVYLLREEDRRLISDKVAKDGRTLVWFHTPGCTDGENLDLDATSSLTGFALRRLPVEGPPSIRLRFPGAKSYSLGEGTLAPLLSVVDPDAETFGTFEPGHEVAVARKNFEDHSAWYVALPSKDVEPLRSILTLSGAHVYARDAVVYDGGGLLCVHAKGPRKLSVRLRSGKYASFDLPEGFHTLVLDPVDGKKLLGDP